MDTVTIKDVVGDTARVSVVMDHIWLACESNPHSLMLDFTRAQAQALIAALQQAVREVEGKG